MNTFFSISGGYSALLKNTSDYQRIVWCESPQDPIQDFRFTTVTFGMKSAPYLATRTIVQLASDEENNFPLAAKIAKRDF